jgi:hypothetical protein
VLTRFTMVYDADKTLKGEVSYWIGAHIVGNVSCSLCDISHGPFRQKQVWKQWVDRLAAQGVEVVALHRNDLADVQHAELSAVMRGRYPCVVGHHDDGTLTFLLGKTELESCNGQVDQLDRLLSPTVQVSDHS